MFGVQAVTFKPAQREMIASLHLSLGGIGAYRWMMEWMWAD